MILQNPFQFILVESFKIHVCKARLWSVTVCLDLSWT